jgi:hypothetical protein
MKKTAFTRVLLILVSNCCVAALAAEEPDLELIMSDPDWIGNEPTGCYWSDFGDAVYYRQKRQGEKFDDLYRVPAAGGNPERV